LILNPGRDDAEVFELGQGLSTIGRSKSNDVFVLHRSLSREHALLVVTGRTVKIEDLGSKNGTFVDDERVERRRLSGTHLIRCGDVVFSFVPDEPRADGRRPGAPTFVYDQGRDPLRQPLRSMLAPGKGWATAIQLVAGSPGDRDREKLQILLKVSEHLSSPAPIDEVLARVLELAFEILDVDRGAIVMADDEGLEPRVTRVRPGVKAPPGFSRQIAGYVLEHGVAALFTDTLDDSRLAAAGSILVDSICCSMCAPLRAKDEVLGVLYVDNLSQADRFGEEDLEFLAAFASQAGIAMHNAVLNARLSEEAVARNNLLRFFPPTTSEAILEEGGAIGSVDTEATMLFSDLSGYTALSSELAPREVIELLNRYFPVMAEIVFDNEGTLEKYIGDALLAVWGAPFARDDAPVLAVGAAVEMQRAMRELNRALDLPRELAIHVGVATGPVVAGNIGTERYLQFATIGDATNVASRICGVARDGEILVDARSAARLGDGFSLEPLDPVAVKGKAEPLELFRVRWE
jgi:adenylate cyclase